MAAGVRQALADLGERQDTPQAERARQWLHGRGIGDELIERYGLVYNPGWLKTAHTNPDTGKPAFLAPGIVIPIIQNGVIWGLKIRRRVGDLAGGLGISPDTKKNGHPAGKGMARHAPTNRFSNTRPPADKYTYFKGSKTKAFFNGDAIQPGKAVVICEGEFDAMVAQNVLGDDYAVVTLGGAGNRIPKGGFDQLQAAPAIYAIFDNDAAGQSAIDALPPSLDVQPITLPKGNDITEYVVEHDGQLAGLTRLAGEDYACWPGGLPDSLRSAILTVAPSGAVLWEHLNTAFAAGELDPTGFARTEVVALNLRHGWGLNKNAIYRGFDALTELLFSKVGIEEREDTIPKSGNKSGMPPNAKSRPATKKTITPVNGAERSLPSDKTARLSGVQAPCSARAFSLVRRERPAVPLHTDEPIGNNDTLRQNPRGRTADLFQLDLWEAVKAALIERLYPKIVMRHHPATGGDDDVLMTPEAAMFDGFDEAEAIVDDLFRHFEPLYDLPEQRQLGKIAQAKVSRDYFHWESWLDDPHNTPLEAAIFRNAIDFRVLYFRAWIGHSADPQNSYAEIAFRLGLSDSAVPAALERAGIENETQYTEKQVRSARHLAQTVRHQSLQVKGWAEKIVLVDDYRDPKELAHIYHDIAANEATIAEALAEGRQVFIKYRVASRQHIVRQEPLPMPLPEREKQPRPSTQNDDETVGEATRGLPPKTTEPEISTEPQWDGTGYDPAWVKAQLQLALRLMKRPVPPDAGVEGLLGLLMGRA